MKSEREIRSGFSASTLRGSNKLKVTDNVLTGNVLAMRFLQKRQSGLAWGEVTGKSVIFPIKYQKSTQGGWYSGFDTFATNQTNTRVLAQLYPKQLYWTVGASGIQVAVNKGPDGVLNFLATEMKSVADDMVDTFGTALYSDGTGTSNKELTGLDAAVDDGKITVAVNKFFYMLETLAKFLVGGFQLNPLKI